MNKTEFESLIKELSPEKRDCLRLLFIMSKDVTESKGKWEFVLPDSGGWDTIISIRRNELRPNVVLNKLMENGYLGFLKPQMYQLVFEAYKEVLHEKENQRI